MKYIKGVFLMGIVVLMSSCLTRGLEDLPAFDEANISNINFDFRYKDEGDKWIDGEPTVKVISLTVQDRVINTDAGAITCRLQVPATSGSFTEAVRGQVSLSSIVGKVNLSTAASIAPIDGAPLLGVPGDFSAPRKYKVTAANGTTKEWTITVMDLSK